MKRIVWIALSLAILACVFAVTASAENALKGDVNSDGNITALDAAFTLCHSVGLELPIFTEANADMDMDGSITPYDAAMMLRAVQASNPTVPPAATPSATTTPEPVSTPEIITTPTPTPAPHVHSWVKQEETGHYESLVIGTEEVAVGTYWEEIGGWDEDRAAFYQCNICGDTFATNSDAGDHLVSAHHGSYSYFPAESVHHNGEWVQRTKYETRDVYGPVWVVDSAAYWVCSCGETRYDEL